MAPKRKRPHNDDDIDVLEHIVAIGAKVRRDVQRRRMFYDETRKAEKTPTEGKANVFAKKRLHAEDVRIYGRNGYALPPWPWNNDSQAFLTRLNDRHYDWEHGDSIPSLPFVRARLSQLPVTEATRHLVDGEYLRPPTPTATSDVDDAWKVLLLRCWDRAVGASSSTMYISSATRNAASVANFDPSQDHNRKGQSSSTPDRVQHAKDLCEFLNIELPGSPSAVPTTCPNCNAQFRDSGLMEALGLGTEQRRACCRSIIQKRQAEKIALILQHRTRARISNTLSSIINSLASESGSEGMDRRLSRCIGWTEILRCAEDQASGHKTRSASSSRNLSNRHDVHTEGEGINNEIGSPILADPVVNSLRRRLIERYADVPF